MSAFTINNKQSREAVFTALYQKVFPPVARYVAKMGGSFDQAKDVFQDALVIYYEKVLSHNTTIRGSETAYIFGIAKHLWHNTYLNEAQNTPLDINNFDIAEHREPDYASQKLMNYLETTGQKCMQMLKAFYYDKLPLIQITQLFGYSGIRSATVQKFKCLEKVRDTVKQKSLSYEDFLE